MYHDLYNKSNARNKTLMNTLHNNKINGILKVIPSNILGVKFGNIEYGLLMKVRLGIPIVNTIQRCMGCAQVMNIYGDHAQFCTTVCVTIFIILLKNLKQGIEISNH